jgi:uncharacterized protein YjbJ (UPF0337 family)
VLQVIAEVGRATDSTLARWQADEMSTRRREASLSRPGIDHAGVVTDDLRLLRASQPIHDRRFQMTNEEQDKGAWEKTKGMVREGAGKMTGDKKMEYQGKAEQVEGDVRRGVGDAEQKMHDATDR